MPLSESRKNLLQDITRKIFFKRKRTPPYSEIEKAVTNHLADLPFVSKSHIETLEDSLGVFKPTLPHDNYKLNLERLKLDRVVAR